MNDEQLRAWKTFRDCGLLWWINRGLHLFGWAIFVECNGITEEVVSVYPKRVDYRGFDREVEEWGYNALTQHLKENAEKLADEAQQ